MKIPKKLKIGGVIYEVQETKKPYTWKCELFRRN